MRPTFLRALRAAAVALAVVSCTSDGPLALRPRTIVPGGASADNVPHLFGPAVVISQVYGGGGNTGATLKNDFIELHNRSNADVVIDGWSVQYASAAGTSWTVQTIGGTIKAGGYYLIQEAAGASGTANLPTPDTSGAGINMSATAGKVWLVGSQDQLSGLCPSGPLVVDQVSFGTAASNCGRLTTGTLANATAAIRNAGDGCAFSDQNLASVFTVAAPNPRNSTAPAVICQPQPFVTMSPTVTTISVSGTQQFQATAFDASGNPSGAALTWTSSAPNVATVDANGVATGLAVGTTTITARTTTLNPNISATATLSVVLLPAPGSDVVISQIYGGGGNSGATLKNDFIELFNRGTAPASLNGWSVQYASATNGFTQVTPLSGTIAPGSYYLVQEAAGNGGTVALPSPDATGSIAMSATAGKVVLALTTTALSDVCPSNVAVVDLVAYGSGTNCGGTTANLSATNAALRVAGGCINTKNPAADFVVAPANPRNKLSPARSCIPGVFDHVALTGVTGIIQATSVQFTAAAQDGLDSALPNAPVTWTSSNPAFATVDATGLVTGVAPTPSGTPVIIKAEATVNGVTKSATISVAVFEPGIHWLDIGYNTTSLPPGFQANMFLTARQFQGGLEIPATFAVEALDPTIADVVPGTPGVIIAAKSASPNKARFRITATPVVPGFPPFVFETGVSTSLTVESPVDAPVSIYGTNDEFGDPTPASASNPNDMLIRRPQYVLSYNQSRGTPNWVSYELDGRQFGPEDRCNCFTSDPNIPVEKRIYTTDYTNGGYDRGHMTRSADRTATNDENAATYYLSNVVPQQGDLNQGVWAQFENALGDSAEAGRAVYIITGPLYSSTHPLSFLKNEGKVAIPDSTWKIAVIGPRDGNNPFTSGGIHTIGDMAGITVLAVNMPNVAGVRNDPWSKYLTTIDKIEKSTGYDFLSVLPKDVQCKVEVRDCDPTAHITGDVAGGTASGVEGQTLHFDASTSTDPDNDQLQYQWSVNGVVAGIGATLDYTFPNNGTYDVKVVVGDQKGGFGSAGISATIANVAPVIGAFSGGSVDKGSAFTSSGSFTDPGSDTWTATVNYGDQSGTQPLSLSGKNFSLSHVYSVAGTFTVTVTVSDGDASVSQTASVNVVNHPPVARITGAGVNGGGEGTPLAFDASTSTDPDNGDILSYQWSVNGQVAGIGPALSYSFPDNGTYTVGLIVSDLSGASNTTSASVTITNVPPNGSLSAPASVVRGGTIALAVTNVADRSRVDQSAGFTYAFDCANGAGFGPFGATPTATCPAFQAGTRVLGAKIRDKDNGVATVLASVNVLAEPTALVRHAPSLSSDVEGSVQMFLGENVTMNGGARISGGLYVPGTPTVRLNGGPTLGANVDAQGSTSPSGYSVTLNGGVSLGTLVRRTDAGVLPSVGAPATPIGTRTVSLNQPSDQVGDWTTVRNVSINGNVAPVTVPGGAYGELTVNGSNTIVLGSAGVTTTYDLQRLTLNGQAVVQVNGPVVITVGNTVQVNGPTAGNAAHPEWLTLRVSQGDLSINGNVAFSGLAVVPNGRVTVNAGSSLTGGVAADQLVLNGNSHVKITVSVP